MKLKSLISIVIPAYNEADNIPQLAKELTNVFKQLPKYKFEVIIVDNGSWDESLAKLLVIRRQDKRFKILQLSRNFECDGGIAAGLAHASGAAAVIMMADLQEPPQLIPKLINKWREGYEIVYGIVTKRTGSSIIRDINSRLFYKVLNFATEGLFPENVSDFRLIDKKVYQVVNNMPEHNKFMRGMVTWTGFKSTGIPFARSPRFAGESKATFKTVLTVALNGIFSFSYVPLRIITIMGFIVSGISFAMIIIQLLLFAAYGRVEPGQNTLVILISFLFGALFLMLGVMGEYIARIYEEVKRRPTFIVKQKIGW